MKKKSKPTQRQQNTAALTERARALKGVDTGPRLMSKPEVMAVVGASFPTIWQWMRAGKFPRAKILGGRSMWLSTDIDKFVAELPDRPLKALKDDAAA